MEMISQIAGWVLLLLGSAFILIGAVGVIRLPDVFARMHGAGIIDTLGAGLILAGLMTQAGFTLIMVKLAFIFIFLIFTNPTATHALARAALNAGVKPLTNFKKTGEDKPSKS